MGIFSQNKEGSRPASLYAVISSLLRSGTAANSSIAAIQATKTPMEQDLQPETAYLKGHCGNCTGDKNNHME